MRTISSDPAANSRLGPDEVVGGTRRRRICMVVHAYYPLDPRVRREATAALEAGHAVDVICMRDAGEIAREQVGGAAIRRLPLRHLPGVGGARVLWEYLAFTFLATMMLIPAGIRRRYDVIHVHNPPDFLLLAALVPRLFGSRIVFDVHDLSPHMFRARFSGKVAVLAAHVLDRIEWLACRTAAAVVTVHEPYRQELIAHGVPATKIVVVMNTLDESLVTPGGAHQARNGDDFLVAYSGTIAPWYGVDLIIDAMARLKPDLPTARALILGAGDALQVVHARVAENDLGDCIEVLGRWLPIEQALARLGEASCGVIPNRPTELNRFALSTKLFEYIALGLPVVVARLETLAAHFDDEEVTFFHPSDPASLAGALRWVATNPAEARAKAERAQVRVAREYSWAASRERYLHTLTRLGPNTGIARLADRG